MDIRNEKNHVFNIRLAKLLGLYKILDPGTIQFRGQNVFQILVGFFVLITFVGTMTLIAGSLYYWTDNTSVTIWYFSSTTNSLFGCYKMWTVFYHSNDIWSCLSITRYDFTSLSSRKRNGHDILDLWRARTVWYTSLLAGVYSWVLVFYAGSLLAFSDAIIPIKNHDGSIGNYRPNVLNLYFIASDETYNEYYNTFFVVETLFVASITIIYLLFDVFLLTLCFAICCQMQIICSAFESVNHKSLSDSHSYAVEQEILRNYALKLLEVYRDNHTDIVGTNNSLRIGKIIANFELFLTTFERVMLSHVFVPSVSLIIIWFNLIMSFSDDGKFDNSVAATVKTMMVIPSISFQIFMPCYLFENLHNQKDSIIFALYSSNWTEMDMKCKKLILITMQLNNANQKKLRFTWTRVVNLEMFFKAMGHCYTVVSVLINYINAKND